MKKSFDIWSVLLVLVLVAAAFSFGIAYYAENTGNMVFFGAATALYGYMAYKEIEHKQGRKK